MRRAKKAAPAPPIATAPAPAPSPTPVPAPAPAPTGAFSAAAANAGTYGGPLLAANSPWNTPIPATARADGNSAAMIANLHLAFTNNRSFAVNLDRYAVPIYYADAATPRVAVKDSKGWWGGFAAVPMPIEARPDPGSDQHLVVWDVPNGVLWEFWKAAKASDGSWSAGAGVKLAANGPGYQTGLWALSARAYGGSLAAGAIRYSEMKAGVIPHALAMAYQYPRGDFYARGVAWDGTVSIGAHCDNKTSDWGDGISVTTAANIPEGARLRLKPSVDIAARANGKRSTLIIGRALQQYGAFMVDHAGAPTLYAENLTGKSVSWAGLLDASDSRPFLASDFEVLSLPALTSAKLR
jgi:hypothetical protein